MTPIPAEAVEALAAELKEHPSAELEIHRKPLPGGPGPELAWRVVVAGVIKRASQRHLEGRRIT